MALEGSEQPRGPEGSFPSRKGSCAPGLGAALGAPAALWSRTVSEAAGHHWPPPLSIVPVPSCLPAHRSVRGHLVWPLPGETLPGAVVLTLRSARGLRSRAQPRSQPRAQCLHSSGLSFVTCKRAQQGPHKAGLCPNTFSSHTVYSVNSHWSY